MAHCLAGRFNISDRAKIATLIFVLSVSFFCASDSFADDGVITPPAPAFNVRIVEGHAQIAQSGLTTTITASTPNIIAQGNLSTITGEIVNIMLLSSTNNALLRSDTGVATSAFGSYFSNGNLFMVNPAGFVFGPTASINAASIVVSTLNINNTDFLKGCETGRFTFVGQGAYIFNQGKLIPQPGGYICLLSQAINNSGIIQAQLGSIVLGAGEKMTLTTIALDDRATISVAIDEAVKTEIFGPDGAKINSAIENSGTISANGGTVTLTAKTLNKVFDYAINNSGIIEANSLIERNGEITLMAEGAPILNTGRIEAGKVTISAIDLINAGNIVSNGLPEADVLGSIYISALTMVQDGRILSDGPVIINVDDLDTTIIFDSNSLGEDSDSAVLPVAVIQGSEVRITFKRLGSSNYPIQINSPLTYIYRADGDIDISDSLGIGTSILLRGPPEGEFEIIYLRDTSLTLDANQVILSGADSLHLYGNITFSNLTSTVPGKTIYFEAGKTYTILGATRLEGALAEDGSISYIYLLSSEKGVQWYIDPQGAHEISYVSVEDSYNLDPRLIRGTSLDHDANSYYWDAIRTATVSGNWNNTATWGGNPVPGIGDSAVIPGGITVTVTADASVDEIRFSGTSSSMATLTVNSGVTLTVTTSGGGSGAIILENDDNSNRSATLAGLGTIICASVTVGGTTTNLSDDATTTLTSTIATLSISGNLNINGEDDGSDDNNATFALASGSVSVAGTINTDEESGSSVTLTLNTGAETGTLILTGSTPFTNIVGSPAFDADGAGATVVYSGAAQTVRPVPYRNLTLSGSDAKTLTSVLTINGNLTLSGTAIATTAADLDIGGNLDVGSGTTFTVAGFDITVTGTTNISGTLTVNNTSGSKTFDNIIINTGGLFNSTVNETYSLTGNLQVDGTGSITSGTGAWIFSGAGTLSGTGSATITNADFETSYSNSGTFSFSDLDVGAGPVINLTNNGTITVTNTLTGSDNFVQGAAGVLNFGGSSIGITGFTTSAAGNTVDYNGAAQTVRAVTYSNLMTSGSGTKTLGGVVTVNSNLTIGSGTTLDVSGSNYALNVNGDWTNNGTFTPRSGTVTFAGSDPSAISGSTTFYNLTCATNDKQLTFEAGLTQTVTNALTLTGTSGNEIILRSSSPGTQWSIDPQGSRSVSYVDVQDSNNINVLIINPSDSTDSGNNLNWFVPSYTISGIAYIDLGSTTLSGADIVLVINGTVTGSPAATALDGSYSFTSVIYSDNSALLVYISGNAITGTTVTTIGAAADILGLDIYGGTLILRHENAGPITNADLAIARGALVDADIIYTVTSPLNVTGNLLVWQDKTFNTQGNAVIISGDLINSGTITTATGTIDITAATISESGTITNTGGLDTNDILLTTTIGGIAVGTITASGLGDVTLNSAGAITDANDASIVNNITAIDLMLYAVTGIGDGNALETEVTSIYAATTNGDVYIDNTSASAATVDTTTGTGNILFNQYGLGDLVVTNAQTVTGNIGIYAISGNLTIDTITAGGLGNTATVVANAGWIADGNDATGPPDVTLNNISSENFVISAANGIGTLANPIETQISNLETTNSSTSGIIHIANIGNLNVTQATTNGTDIILEAASNIYVHNISTNEVFDGTSGIPSSGTVTIIASGYIEDGFDAENPDAIYDITANNIILDAALGVGTDNDEILPDAPIELMSSGLSIPGGGDVVLYHKGTLHFGGFDGNSFTLVNSGDLYIEGDIITSDPINLSVIDDPNLFINALLDSGGAPVNLSATEDIVHNSSGDVTTHGGAFSGTADSDGNGTGVYDLQFGAVIDTTSGIGNGTALLSADDINIAGAVFTGDANVTIKPSSNQTIALAAGIAFGHFGLSNDEVSQIATTGIIIIGSSAAGNITVNSLDQPGVQIKLVTDGSVLEQGNEPLPDIVAGRLIFDVAGDVGTLTNAFETLTDSVEGAVDGLIHILELGDLNLNTLTAGDAILEAYRYLYLPTAKIIGNPVGTNLIANTAILDAADGIDLDTQVGQLSASVREADATGDIKVENIGDLALNDLMLVKWAFPAWGYSVRNFGSGDIDITTTSPITVNADVIANGNVILTANGGADGNIIINDPATIESTASNVDINAGKDVLMYGSSDVIAAIDVDIDAGGEVVVSNSTIIAGDDVFIDAVDNISLGVINAANSIHLNTTAGSIVDTNIDVINLTTPNLYMDAYYNIGIDGDRIDTDVDDIWQAIASYGNVLINEFDGVNLWNIRALASTIDIITGGDTYAYYVYAEGDGGLDPAIVKLLVNNGDLFVPPTGKIIANQTTNGIAAVNLNVPDGSIFMDAGLIQAYVTEDGSALITLNAGSNIKLIDGSEILSQVFSGEDSAIITLTAGVDIELKNSHARALVIDNGPAFVMFDAENNISLTADSRVSANAFEGISNVTFRAFNIILENSVVRANTYGSFLARIFFDADNNILLDTGSKVVTNEEWPDFGGLSRIRFDAGNNIRILNNSEVKSNADHASAWISFNAYNDINLTDSLVRAFSKFAPSEIGGAYIDFTTEAGDIILNHSEVRAIDPPVENGNAQVSFSSANDILITNDSLVKARNYFDGTSTVNLSASHDIIVADSAVIARVDGSGVAALNLEAGNSINISQSEEPGTIRAYVAGNGDAAVNMTATSGDITVNNDYIIALVDGYGHAGIDMDAGDGIIIINNSLIGAYSGGSPLTAEVDLDADYIDIEDSTVEAVVYGDGTATITINANGGDLDVINSTIQAVVSGTTAFNTATVNLYALNNITIDPPIINSSILAQVVNGLARIFLTTANLDIVVINSILHAIVGDDGDATITFDAGEDIEIDPSTITASVGNDGSATIEMTAGGNIEIIRSHVEANVVGDGDASVNLYAANLIDINSSLVLAMLGAGLNTAEVNMSADAIEIADSEVGAVVDDDGTAEVNLTAEDGNIVITDSLLGAIVSGEGDAHVNLNASNLIDIDGSWIIASIGWGFLTAEVNMSADAIEITDSEVDALVYGDGTATVEMDAHGGDINIENSAVLADVNGYGHAHVSLYAYSEEIEDDGGETVGGDINIIESSVRAEIDYNEDDDDDVDTALINFTAYGSISITDSLIEALVKYDGSAYVYMYAYGNEEYSSGGITIDNSSVSAEVAGYGSAYVNLYTYGYPYYYSYGGSIDILNDSTVLASIAYSDDTAGIQMYSGNINIEDSTVHAISTDPEEYGYSYVNLYAYGNYDYLEEYYYPGSITIDNSSVSAEVAGYGSAYVNLYTYGYPYYYSYGGSIDILNDSTVLASIAYSDDTAGIQMYSGNINIEDSTVHAISTDPEEYGYSYVNLYAYGNYDYWAEYYYPGSITIDNSSVSAEVAGYGSAYVNIFTYWYYGYYYGGSIDILNNSHILASIAGSEDTAGIQMYSGDITIEDSTVQAISTDPDEYGYSYVNLYAYGNYDYYYGWIPGTITVDNSSVSAEVAGYGSAYVNMFTYWYYGYYYGGDIDILNNSNILASVSQSEYDSAGIQMYSGNITIEDSTVQAISTDPESYGYSYIYIYAYGDTYYYYYGYPGTITIDNSSVSAEVAGYGSAYVGMYTYYSPYYYYYGYYYGGSIDILNNSHILASIAGSEDTAGIQMYSGNITIEDSTVQAISTDPESYGYSYIYLYAYGDLYEEGNAAGTITIDNSDISAEVAGYGSAYVNLQTYRLYPYYYYYYNGGAINILNNSNILASVARSTDDSAGITMDSGDITIKDSSVRALVTDPNSYGNSYININAYTYSNDYDWMGQFDGGNILIDNSEILAKVAGWGEASVYMSANRNGYYSYYSEPDENGSYYYEYGYIDHGGRIDIINDSSVLAEIGSGDDTASVTLNAGDITVDNSSVIARVLGDGSTHVTINANGNSGWYNRDYYYYYYYEESEEGEYNYDHTDYFEFDNAGTIDILDSTVLAQVGSGFDSAEVNMEAGIINIQDSTVSAIVDGDGEAYVYMYAYGNGELPGAITVDNSYVSAEVAGYGSAYMNMYTYEGEEEDYAGSIDILNDSTILASVGSGNETAEVNMYSGAITVENSSVIAHVENEGSTYIWMYAYGGDINIINSDVIADPNGGDGHAQVSLYAYSEEIEDDGGGTIGGNINITDGSLVHAESHISEGPIYDTAIVMLIADEDMNIDEISEVSALSLDDTLALVLALAGGAIDAPGLVSATSTNGIAAVVMFAPGDIFAGNVSAAGNAEIDIIALIEGFLGVDIATQFSYSSAVLIVSIIGDITLGDVSADAVIAAALGFGEEVPSGSIFDVGDITAHYLGLLARYDIGTSIVPINTDVDILSAFSWDTGNIYINEANDIELGLYLPIFSFESEDGPIQIGAIGASVAANNGIIHIVSGGDMLVNSIVAPNGGVFLETIGGSIFAGRGWCPTILGDGLEDGFEFYIFDWFFLMDGWAGFGGPDFFTALLIAPVMTDSPDLPVGPNVIAGSYSYFSAPTGTIGVGTPEDISVYNPLDVCIQVINPEQPAVPDGFIPEAGLTLLIGGSSAPDFLIDIGDGNGPLGVSGAIRGIVRPGVIPVTLAYLTPVAPALDQTVLSPLFPPGYVFHDDTIVCCSPLLPYLPATNEVPYENYDLATQIWPPAPGAVPAAAGFTNWLLLVEELTRGRHDTYESIYNIRLAQITSPRLPYFYFYHPLTPYDMAAFDAMVLNAAAYQMFIDGTINLLGHEGLMPLFEEFKKKKK